MMKFVPKILLVAVLLTAYSCKRFPNPFAEHNAILAEVQAELDRPEMQEEG